MDGVYRNSFQHVYLNSIKSLSPYKISLSIIQWNKADPAAYSEPNEFNSMKYILSLTNAKSIV